MKKQILLLFLGFSLVACQEDSYYIKDSKSYMRFTANNVKYDLDILTVTGFDSLYNYKGNFAWIVCYQSVTRSVENGLVYARPTLPSVTFGFPFKTGVWNQSDSIQFGIQIKEGETFIKQTYDSNSTINITVTEFGKIGGYCSGTFSGKLKNEAGNELNLENGVFKIKIQNSYFNY